MQCMNAPMAAEQGELGGAGKVLAEWGGRQAGLQLQWAEREGRSAWEPP